jgi:hypothetical protein
MKKLFLVAAGISLFAASYQNVLPKNFGKCVELGYFNIQNPLIPLNDYMIVIKKYDCNNNILYIGIEDRIPGILKIKEDKNSKDFLIKHCKINGFDAAVYIDKGLKKGVLAIKLNNKYTLKVLFNSTDYKSIINLIKKIDLNKIKKKLS